MRPILPLPGWWYLHDCREWPPVGVATRQSPRWHGQNDRRKRGRTGPTGTGPTGTGPTGTGPTGTSPTGTGPTGTGPTGTGPASAEPVSREPAGTDQPSQD